MKAKKIVYMALIVSVLLIGLVGIATAYTSHNGKVYNPCPDKIYVKYNGVNYKCSNTANGDKNQRTFNYDLKFPMKTYKCTCYVIGTKEIFIKR